MSNLMNTGDVYNFHTKADILGDFNRVTVVGAVTYSVVKGMLDIHNINNKLKSFGDITVKEDIENDVFYMLTDINNATPVVVAESWIITDTVETFIGRDYTITLSGMSSSYLPTIRSYLETTLPPGVTVTLS